MALLVLFQALALSFHLATERHLVAGDLIVGGGDPAMAPVHATGLLSAAAPADDDGVGEDPHAPHAAIDHQVAQDRIDDDLLLPSLWLPLLVAVNVPRDCCGVTAGAPPTGPPLARQPRTSIAARAPPRS